MNWLVPVCLSHRGMWHRVFKLTHQGPAPTRQAWGMKADTDFRILTPAGKSWKLKLKFLESPEIYLWFKSTNMYGTEFGHCLLKQSVNEFNECEIFGMLLPSLPLNM